MGLEASYQPPRTSRAAPEPRIYPYLLRGLSIERVNQVWTADLCYLPMARGFLCLTAVMDLVSRYVLAWRLSNLLEASFCVEALQEALGQGHPEIFNTDQVVSSPTTTSPACLLAAGSPSAWTGADGFRTTSFLSGCAQSQVRGGLAKQPRSWALKTSRSLFRPLASRSPDRRDQAGRQRPRDCAGRGPVAMHN